jgi:signal transduction histidine kinase/DNA-binding response OmpR family regulator/CHASE3 domain sensor protein
LPQSLSDTSSVELDHRSQLSRRLTTAIATPLVLLVVLGVALGRQLLEMANDSAWVEHTDQVLAEANDALRKVADQENAVASYLVSRDRDLLEPFETLHPLESFATLRELVADNREQQARFESARAQYETWFSIVRPVVAVGVETNAQGVTRWREGKAHIDAMRDLLTSGIGVEEGLRRARVKAAAASTETTKVVFIGLLTAAALLLAFLSRRQLRAIASSYGEALSSETAARAASEAEAWVRAGQNRLVEALQGERTIEQLGALCLEQLAAYCQADVGAFFIKESGGWRRRAGYALDSRAAGPETFLDGEGIIGRAAIDGKVVQLRELPNEFLKVVSGTGQATPGQVVVVPARIESITHAVLELGFLRPVPARTLDLLGRIGDGIALAVRSSEYKQRLRELLEEAHRQAEELQTQQEELRVANEELDSQASALKATQKQLETQQAELEQTNDNLTQQSQLLERQNLALAEKQSEVVAKAHELERASQFKSDFLSNMSHELRTPLNSSLILAKLLADNRAGNLTDEQVKFAQTIYGAGNDLLMLINDILDLSKIESGKMEVHAEPVPLEKLRDGLLRTFEAVARQKQLAFAVSLGEGLPQMIETDAQRLDQVLKNLISNALKFTERGEVSLSVATHGERIEFAVRDTGIGIAPAQQSIIFEAFRQADGTTNRKYGGTGLGLSISRELARLLGGDIAVDSEPGRGSTFTLSLPRVYAGPVERAATALPATSARPPGPSRGSSLPGASVAAAEEAPPESTAQPIIVEPGARLSLIIEDDPTFASILQDVAREAGFQCLVASTAQQGFELAKKYVPTGIILDMKLPDHTGLFVLDRLKRDPATRHIPVHVVSAADHTQTALSMGAAAYLVKPVAREQLVEAFRDLEVKSSRHLRRVLVVEDDPALRTSVANLLGRTDVEIKTAATVAEALAFLHEQTFDCIVTDLALPDQSGFEMLERIAGEEPYTIPPVIVYTGRSLDAREEQRLRKYSKSIIIKGARSPERLLDEVTLFLHQVESELPAAQQRLLESARHREAIFEGRRVLIVEDDVRNVFALSSVLEPKGVKVTIARNGKEALAALDKDPSIELVLMDVMMPEMDGLEATRIIRKDPSRQRLPIIALTAKAMRDDHERCLEAGANDYLAKPLDVEMLLSLLRVWMPKG